MNSEYSNVVETLESRQLFSDTAGPLSFAPPPNMPRSEDTPVLNATAGTNAGANDARVDDEGMRPNRPRVSPPGA